MIKIKTLHCDFPQFKDLVDAYIPPYVIIPLKDADSELCTSKVTENSRVAEGEIIAQKSHLSPAIHATVPGIVTGFKTISVPDGKKTNGVIIRTDGSFSYLGRTQTPSDWDTYSSADILSLLYENGVIDTFDRTRSLASVLNNFTEKNKKSENPILAVRLFSSDPTVKTGEFLAQRKLPQIIEGAKIIAKAVSIKKIAFIVSSGCKSIWSKAGELFKSSEETELNCFKADTSIYPASGKREIKKLLIKNKCHFDGLLTIDGNTAFMVYEAVALNKPVLEKYVQFTGTPLASEKMFRVRIGTPIRKLVEECGGFRKSVYKIVINGLIKGTAVSDLNTPITADLQSVTFLPKTIVPYQKQVNCIRCGRCHRACPKNIHADKLFSHYCFHTEIDEKVLAMADECTLCGVCDTACPARLPLAQTISLLQGGKN